MVIYLTVTGVLIIVTLLEVLKLSNHKLMQTAWNYMNDSLRSEVFLRYHPESIACACIYLSARVLQIPLPNKPAWYLIFDVTEEDILSICHIILSLYTCKKPDPDRLEKAVDVVKVIHQEKKLKAKGLSNANAIFTNHHSFSPTSVPSSPKNGKSPNVDSKKDKEDSKTNNGISPKESNHRKRRSVTPVNDDDSPHRKKVKNSSSRSASSRSPTPPRHSKHGGKTPPRGYKDSRKSRSRSHSPKLRDMKKSSKHRSSGHKSHKRNRSRSVSPASPIRSGKHSSSNSGNKKSYKSKSSKNRSPTGRSSYEHNHHHITMHDKHKSSRKEKNQHHSSKEKSSRR